MISGIFERWRAFAAASADFRWVFLDTPVEKCITNVEKRRAGHSKKHDFNPSTLIEKHRAIESVYRKARDARMNVWRGSPEAAVELVTGWL